MVILPGLHSLHNEPFLFVFSNVWLFKSPMGEQQNRESWESKETESGAAQLSNDDKGTFPANFSHWAPLYSSLLQLKLFLSFAVSSREKSDEEVVRALVLSRTSRLRRPRSLSTRPLSEFQQRQQEKGSESTEVASLSLNERGRVRYRQPPTGVLNNHFET